MRRARPWRVLHGLAAETRGVTVVEFAIVAPTLCLFLVGALDIAHTLYMQSTLEGAVQKAARDSALETGIARNSDGAVDLRVRNQILQIDSKATFAATRRYYRTFSKAQAAQAEPFTDTDSSGACNNGEPFTDLNNNGVWDADGADDGQGGAKDKVIYTVLITYPRIVPLFAWIGVPDVVKMSATTILQNQPYGDQGVYGPPTYGNCS